MVTTELSTSREVRNPYLRSPKPCHQVQAQARGTVVHNKDRDAVCRVDDRHFVRTKHVYSVSCGEHHRTCWSAALRSRSLGRAPRSELPSSSDEGSCSDIMSA